MSPWENYLKYSCNRGQKREVRHKNKLLLRDGIHCFFFFKNHVHTCIVMSSNYSCNMRFIEVNNLYQIMKYLLLTGEYYWSHWCWGERHVWKEEGGAQYCSMKLTFKVVGKQNKSGVSICVLLRSWGIQNVDLFVRESLFKL